MYIVLSDPHDWTRPDPLREVRKMFGCRRVVFYQFENSLLADQQINYERLEHPDDHTDIVRCFHLATFF